MTISTDTRPACGTLRKCALTSAEQRIFFDHRRTQDDAAANSLASVLRIDGPLDVADLRSALQSVLRRHDRMTSTYHDGRDGQPYRLPETVVPEWTGVDLSTLDPAAADRRVRIIRRRELSRPFDLTAQAPARIALIRLDDTRHVLILVTHAIAWDWDSLEILLRDLTAVLNGEEFATSPADISPTPPSSGDRDFWRAALADLPPAVAIGTDARPTTRTETTDIIVDLDPDLLTAARRCADERGVPLTAVLMAAHSALVLRYTGATDIVTAVPAVSADAERRPSISQRGNTVLIRTRPEPQEPFDTHIAAVAQTLAGVGEHCSAGIDEVISAIRPSRVPDAHGLGNLARIGFAVHQPITHPEIDGLTIRVLEAERPRPSVPWHLAVELHPTWPQLRLTTNHVHPSVNPYAYARQYLSLLAAAVAEPGQRIGRLPMLSNEHRDRILDASRGERQPHPATTLVAVLDATAKAMPNNVALRADHPQSTVEITYRELDARANRLARHLIAEGIGTEDIVGLALPGSVGFVIAALAVLKSGAAYLPIDPSYPPNRIEALRMEANPRFVWDRRDIAVADSAAAQQDSSTVSDRDRLRPLRPDNLAYVMYTSGSTGTPKGVPVAHSAIADHVIGFGEQWDIPAQSRVLQTSSVSFDASLLDIFVTLSVGATLVLPDPARTRDLTYLADLIAKHRVTMLHLVPSLLREFIGLPQRTEWGHLTHIAVGGDRLVGEIADRALTIFDAEIRNYYGPTEAVVSATHHRVPPASGAPIEPIGMPNLNVDAYLLDDSLELVPDGVVGELYLGGEQLARGYLDLPELTAGRFVANPFAAARTGSRLYRTGDLGRRRADGTIDFVGRTDDQVKIRGHRVELGEVAAVLRRHRDVDDCVVVSVTDRNGDATLHAYLVGIEPKLLDPAAVRDFAVRRLPEFMVPVAYAVLGSLPRTSTGKVDTAALCPAYPIKASGNRLPVSVTEIAVANLFERFFDVDRVHADDSFFDLGGHSLTAHRLLAALREAFGVRIDVADLFAAPTVAGLATTVEATRGRWPRFDAFAAPATNGYTAVSLTAAQELAWRSGPHNVISISARPRAAVDRSALLSAIATVADRHDAIRLILVEDDARHDGLRMTLADSVDIVDASSGTESGQDVVADSFDTGEPLWRFRLSGPTESPALTITAHRAAADAYSLRSVLGEIADLYSQAIKSADPAPGRFLDYARWYESCALDDGASSEWWRTTYADLVADTPRAAHATGRTTEPALSNTMRLDPGVRRRLQALSAKSGIADNVLYEAAVAAVARLLGAGVDVILGGETGREFASSAHLIGPLTATSILRFDLSGDPTLASIIDQARIAAYGADTAPGVPVDVHRTVALAELSALPKEAARVRFTTETEHYTLDFGAGVIADIDASTTPPATGVVVTCRPVDGTVEIVVSAPAGQVTVGDIEDWTAQLDRTLVAFVDAPDQRLSELACGRHK